MVNVELIIVCATFISSVASPIITAVINNRHADRIYNRQFLESHRAEVIESYLKHAGAVIVTKGQPEPYEAYASCYGEALMYVPENLRDMMIEINGCISSFQYADAQSKYFAFCERLYQAFPGRTVSKE